ncbi:Cytochrome P450 2E1 [Halotydeus destructor]|nr:Cytochrome P450 2E1 [Halotydeus destructor]
MLDSKVLLFAFGTIAFYMVSATISWYMRFRKRPPGPYGLPVVGYYPFLRPAAYKDFTELGKKYGDVFPVNMLGNDYYVLNTLEAIKECLNQDAANYRPEEYYFFHEMYDRKSVASMNGENWKVHRKFLVQNVMNTPTLLDVETRLVSITDQFIAHLKSTKGQPVDIHHGVSSSMMNLTGSLLYSKQFNWDDSRVMALKTGTDTLHIMRGIELALAGKVYRFMMRVYHRTRHNKVLKARDDAMKVISEIVSDRLTNGYGNHGDILDELLRNHFDEEESHVPQAKRRYTVENVEYTLFNILVAGTGTPTDTFYRMMQQLALNPNVQDKLHKEIDDVVGNNDVTFSHRPMLHYTQAVIEETIRFNSLSPLALTRQAQEDIKVGNVTIPKGDYIISNLYASMHNADSFPEPETFKPERFLDKHGQFVRHEANCQFTFGKRSCPGMAFGKKDLFYLLVSTMRQFQVKLPARETSHSINVGSFQTLRPFELCAISRS